VEFKPAGDVLNQTSEHLNIHISISKTLSENYWAIAARIT